jgi:type I restriction enzyme, S subunit
VKESTEAVGHPRLRFPEYRDAAHWRYSSLGAVASFHKGRGVSKADIDPDGSRSCIRYGELYTRYSEVIGEVHSRTSAPDAELFLSEPNDVIVPASGETKEDIATAACVLLGGIALGGDLNVIRSEQSGPFISYSLNGPLKRRIAKLAQGDTVVHLYPSQLERLRVAFPELPEQDKIAACLTSLDAVIATQGRKVEALKTYKRGLIQQLFPREGEALPELRFPEFLSAPPWSKNSLGKLSAIVRGGSPRPIEAFLTSDEDGLNWLKIGDVDREAKYITRTTEKVRAEAIAKTRVIQPGDFILSNSMSFGRPYISQIQTCIHDGWIAVTKLANTLDDQFLYYSILSEPSQRFLDDQAAGSGVRNLNVEIVKALPVLMPSAPEQIAVSQTLSLHDELIDLEYAKLNSLREQKAGLLTQLFPLTVEE